MGQEQLYCLGVTIGAGSDEGRVAVLLDHPVHTALIKQAEIIKYIYRETDTHKISKHTIIRQACVYV